MSPEQQEAKPQYKPNRAERRFVEAMKRKKELNPRQVKSLEWLEQKGVKV